MISGLCSSIFCSQSHQHLASASDCIVSSLASKHIMSKRLCRLLLLFTCSSVSVSVRCQLLRPSAAVLTCRLENSMKHLIIFKYKVDGFIWQFSSIFFTLLFNLNRLAPVSVYCALLRQYTQLQSPTANLKLVSPHWCHLLRINTTWSNMRWKCSFQAMRFCRFHMHKLIIICWIADSIS